MDELIRKKNEFNLADALGTEDEPAPRELPTTNPLFNIDLKSYTV